MVVPLLPSPLSGTINKPQRKMATRQKNGKEKMAAESYRARSQAFSDYSLWFCLVS